MRRSTAPPPVVGTNATALAFLLRHADMRDAAVAVVAQIGVSLTEGFGVLTLVPILSRMEGAAGADAWTQRMNAVLGFAPSIVSLLVFTVVLALVRAVLQYLQKIKSSEFQLVVIDRLRSRAFAAVLHAEWRWLVRHRASDHSSLIVTNVARVGQGLNQLIAACSVSIAGTGYLIAAFLLSWRLALFTIVAGALVMAAFAAHRRRAIALGFGLSASGRALHGSIAQGLDGVRIIKAYDAADRQSAKFDGALAEARSQYWRYDRLGGFGQGLLQVGGAAVLAMMLGFGHFVWGVALPTLLPLLLVFSRLAPMLGSIQSAWSIWGFSRAAVVEMEAFLAETEAEREPVAAGPPPPLAQAITLHDVCVDYTGRDALALDRVTLAIPANSTTALCGASGAGKSTLADVLMGLIAPDSGSVDVDGVRLEGATRIAWRRSVAYVQQDPFLFHDTIRANILLGREGIDEAAIIDALVRAGAKFVLALPDGLETMVGDGGVRLSGGERQRVALARALVGAPALVILDEATSALDPEHELEIRRTMRALRGQVTLVFISHRESMREDADQVVMLDHGRIVPAPHPASRLSH